MKAGLIGTLVRTPHGAGIVSADTRGWTMVMLLPGEQGPPRLRMVDYHQLQPIAEGEALDVSPLQWRALSAALAGSLAQQVAQCDALVEVVDGPYGRHDPMAIALVAGAAGAVICGTLLGIAGWVAGLSLALLPLLYAAWWRRRREERVRLARTANGGAA